MQRSILIGIAAGLATAVVFLSATTGPMLMRAILFLLTPLPLFLAGLATGWVAAAAGGIAGTIAIALVTAPMVGVVFAASEAVPVAVLTYLVMLSRPAAAPGPDVDPTSGLEWYPIGRVVIWAAVLSAAMAMIAMLMLGPDLDTLRTAVRKLVDEWTKVWIEATGAAKEIGEPERQQLADVAMYILPGGVALSWMMTALLNLWLAGRIVLAAGQLGRPWPDIAAMRYPRFAPLVLAGASVATLISGYPALFASALSGAFYLAYVLMGLAVVHYITRGQAWRPFALWALYAVLLVLNTGVSLVIALLGLADGFIPIRRGGPPPNLPGPPASPRPPST